MTTVFLSGSRHLSRLNDAIRVRLRTITDKGFAIIVGDANGADKAIQGFLANETYRNVTVFCAGPTCRNNVGGWEENHVEVDPKLKGRAFYTVKDNAVAAKADYGFVLWDGKSAGSVTSMIEPVRNGKPAVVYFAPDKSFHAVKTTDDVFDLLQHCDGPDIRAIDDKIDVGKSLGGSHSAQGALTV